MHFLLIFMPLSYMYATVHITPVMLSFYIHILSLYFPVLNNLIFQISVNVYLCSSPDVFTW